MWPCDLVWSGLALLRRCGKGAVEASGVRRAGRVLSRAICGGGQFSRTIGHAVPVKSLRACSLFLDICVEVRI